MTDERFLAPSQIAKMLGVSVDKVAAFIDRGELIAVNTSLSARPRWKVEPASLRRFIESRSNARPAGAGAAKACHSPEEREANRA